MLDSNRPEDLLSTALSAMERGNGYKSILDRFPVPVYTTDAEGRVTYWIRPASTLPAVSRSSAATAGVQAGNCTP